MGLSSEVRDEGSGNPRGPSLLEKVLMRRYGSHSLWDGTPVILNNIQTNTTSDPTCTTPPSGANTKPLHPPRADAACSNDTSHAADQHSYNLCFVREEWETGGCGTDRRCGSGGRVDRCGEKFRLRSVARRPEGTESGTRRR